MLQVLVNAILLGYCSFLLSLCHVFNVSHTNIIRIRILTDGQVEIIRIVGGLGPHFDPLLVGSGCVVGGRKVTAHQMRQGFGLLQTKAFKIL